jgi:dsRNA-specific ribonuclease
VFANSEAQLITGRKIRIVAFVNGKEYSGIGLNKKFAKTAAAKCALRALKSKSKTI